MASIVTVTPTVLSGLAVPEALESDLDASTAGQYGPLAGYPEPVEDALGRRPALTLTTTGEQTAGRTVHIQVQTPGAVGQAGFIARRTVSGTLDGYWRGANLPAHLTGGAFQGWSSISNQYRPHAVTLPDDGQVVVFEQTNGTDRDIKAQVWSASSGSYASASTVKATLDASHTLWPALLLMGDPGGGADPILLCAYWNPNDTTNEAQVDISFSRDGGTTWSLWAKNVLPSAIDINSGSPYYTLGRIRMTLIGGQIALFAHLTASSGATKEYVYQYRSGDGGVSFSLVAALEDYGFPDAVSVGNVGYVALIRASDTTVYLWRLASAALSLANVSPVQAAGQFGASGFAETTGSPDVFTFAAVAMAAGRDGKIYLFGLRAISSSREGSTSIWDPLTETETIPALGGGVSIQYVWWDDANSPATEYPINICATMYRGQARLYCTMESNDATYDLRITRLDLGGPNTITMPARSPGSPLPTAWKETTIPTDAADTYGAVFSGAGTRSTATNPGWETLTTTANQAYYQYTFSGGATTEIVQLIRVRVDSGGGVSSRVIACGIRMAGVGYGFEFELRFSTTQIRFRDVGGATDETTVTVDTSAVDVLLAMRGDGTASTWYRSGTDEDQNFLPIEVAFALTDDAGAGGTTNIVMWGNRASGTAVSRWWPIGRNYNTVIALADGLTLPDDLRPIPFAPVGAHALAGVSVGATGGPALVGDAWTIYPDAERPVRHLAPVGDEDSARSLRGGQRTSSTEEASSWWGTATSGDVVLRYVGSANRYLSALMAFHVEGCEGRDPSVIAYNADTAATDVLGTLTNSTGGLRFIRASASSPVVRVDTSGTSSTEPYARSGSLKGGWVNLGSGKLRPILDNSEGRWSNDGDAAPMQLRLGGIDGTEPVSGTGGVIIYPRATFLFAASTTTEYAKFGLRWSSAPDLYSAQLRCKVFAVCRVEPLLYAREWGTDYQEENPAELYESRSGLRRGRALMTGTRRTLSIPLGMLWDQRPIVDPDHADRRVYKAYSNSVYPIAGVMGDEFGKLLGAWRRAGGSEHPVLWLPRITYNVTTQSLVGANAGFYCRITETPSFTSQYGRDGGAQFADVWKGSTWTLSEER